MNEPCNINTIGANAVFTQHEGLESGSRAEMLAALPQCTQEKVLHIHPLQTIILEPLDGTLGIMLADRRLIIKAGKSFVIPRNTEFALYNADEKEVTFKSTLTPALHTEWLTRELTASAKRKKSGWTAAIERSYIISQIKGEYYRSGLPVMLQNIIHPVLAFIGKAMGIDKRVSPVY